MLRNSILILWPVIPEAIWKPVNYAVLIGCGLVLAIGRRTTVMPLGLLLVVAALVGSAMSLLPEQSLPKWAGWALLVMVAGPGVSSEAARQLRASAWRTMRLWLLAVGVVSAGWFFLRLPVLGFGDFTGVMMHSMLVGPMAGMGAVYALNFAITRKSVKWASLAALCVVPCMASGSRVAVGALAVAIAAVLLGRFRLSHFAWLAVVVLVSAHFFGRLPFESDSVLNEMTRKLSEKGLVNSREDLWRDRLQEFKTHPFFGVGVGMAEGAGQAVDEEGMVNVEPGSSYLALLSMTGGAGAAALACLVIQLGLLVKAKSAQIPRERLAELMGIGAFLAVHAVAEGWILGVGSPLCFIFWLWLGNLADAAVAAEPINMARLTSSRTARGRRLNRSEEALASRPATPVSTV
ncbi:MAG: O-antigen ligase family protein, partial [Verrucomicrobia bacterium]|nr:O-antigen ligase family protein [Verrucomicrobiota bacterium]